MANTTAEAATSATSIFDDDDFLSGAVACPIDAGEDCEACQ